MCCPGINALLVISDPVLTGKLSRINALFLISGAGVVSLFWLVKTAASPVSPENATAYKL
jgi:hypothetical protein